MSIFSGDEINYILHLFGKIQVKTKKVCKDIEIFLKVLKKCVYKKVKTDVKKENIP